MVDRTSARVRVYRGGMTQVQNERSRVGLVGGPSRRRFLVQRVWTVGHQRSGPRWMLTGGDPLVRVGSHATRGRAWTNRPRRCSCRSVLGPLEAGTLRPDERREQLVEGLAQTAASEEPRTVSLIVAHFHRQAPAFEHTAIDRRETGSCDVGILRQWPPYEVLSPRVRTQTLHTREMGLLTQPRGGRYEHDRGPHRCERYSG